MNNPVRLVIGGGVQCFGLPTQIRDRAIKDLTFDNMAYKNAVKYGKYIAPNIHPFHEFFYYDRVNDILFCPKGYIRPLLTMLRKADVKYKIKDNTYSLPKDNLLHLEFKGKLRSYQEQAVSDMLRYPNGLLEAKTGSGKCLGKGTEVLMHDGSIKLVEDVAVGDLVMGPDSNPRKVTSLARGREELYKIIPTKGNPYVVNKSHILSLKISGDTACMGYAPNSIVNMEVSEYIKAHKTFKHRAKGWRTGVEFNGVPDSIIPPYILGVWLGDGASSFRDPNKLTFPDAEILKEVYTYAASIGMDVHEIRQEGKCPLFRITNGRNGNQTNVYTQELRNLNVCNNKHIPKKFLIANRESRLQLLAGIMDTDGHLTGNGYDYVAKQEQLAKDVTFLARSLGLSAYMGEKMSKSQTMEKPSVYYRVSICGDCSVIPCRVSRKKATRRQQRKDVLRTGILKVKAMGVGDYYGFTLSGPDRLFLLGDFTVTHNTVMAIALISKRKQPTLIIVHSKELLHQWCTRIRDFLGYQAGILGDGQYAVHPITVGIAKSVKKHADSIKRKFGLVIVDECHKTPSTTFTECLIKLYTKYTIGLSATPFRNDGLDRAINAFIGPTLHVVSSQELEDVGAVLKPKIYYVKTNYFTPKIAYIDIIQDLSKNAKRNKLVADVAVADIKQQNEAILIAVDRVQMGREISKILTECGYPNYLLHGSVPSDKRKRIVADMRSGNVKILIATVSLIGEGFDMDKLHSLLLASPFKYPGRVIQVAGRVLRPEKGKTARIYDFRDDDITVLRKHGAVRQTVYKSQGWCQ